MRTKLAIRITHLLERYFPERRIFLRSEDETRFLRLRPGTQLIAASGSVLVLAWTIVATAILVMDNIGATTPREQARRDRDTYEQRLNDLATERDARAREARTAQGRFNAALERVSAMQEELLHSETRQSELKTGIDLIQRTLRHAMDERDAARAQARKLAAAGQTATVTDTDPAADAGTVAALVATLRDTAAERDLIDRNARQAVSKAEEMSKTIRLMQEENDAIFRQVEDALTVSVEPLNKMFRKAGLDPDKLIDTVKRGYSGLGGDRLPAAVSTSGGPISQEAERAQGLLKQMDRLNLYRIAAEKTPLVTPLHGAYHFTSPFGRRWGKMHEGVDLADPYGTPIYATAGGVVIYAGWMSGYGRLVKIRHAFGLETRYGHMSKIRVKKGQRVSRGDRIGDMGSSGRSTGPHVHYEVRVGGTPVDPMKFIKAGRDVF